MKKYPNDVKVVIKNFPLRNHKQANKAALYSLAAGRQGMYHEMHKMIFDNYRGLKNNEDLPLQYAYELGLDIDQFNYDMQDPSLQAQIDLEVEELRNTGLRLAVPKFIVNGYEKERSKSLDTTVAEILNKKK